MSDRQPIRDRTLVLRILVPGLETGLRDKVKDREDKVTEREESSTKETLLDLEGVTCEPTQEGSTLWNFHCDGATYPARLVNMPCPIELHKTHDHVMYFKCVDIAQMLIVYEDSMALDEADAHPKIEGSPSYYHSGMTGPLKRVVERRFALREQVAVPPPRAQVSDVEKELLELMCKISKEGGKRNKVPSLASAQHANKVLEEVVEDIVDYEPWMDDYGAQPSGIEISAGDQMASLHPEIWLDPDTIDSIKAKEREKEEEILRKKQATAEKKTKKKKKQKEAAAAAAAALAAAVEPPPPTGGIGSEVTPSELDMMTTEDLMGDVALEDDENPFDLGFDLDNMDIPGLTPGS